VNVRKVQGSTAYRYGKILDEFVGAIGDVDPSTVTGEQIEQWMTRVRPKGRVGAAGTQRLDRSVVSSLFEFLLRTEVVSKDPTLLVGVPKVRNVQSKALSDEDFVSFWNADLYLDERVMFGLGLFAGLRRAEIMSVAPSSFDVGRERIDFMVRKGGSQFGVEYGAAVRSIARHLPHLLSEDQAQRWLDQVSEMVLYRWNEKVLTPWDLPASEAVRQRYSLTDPWMPDPVVMNKRLSKCLRRIDWPRHRMFHPHAFRHTAATNLARCGVPLDVLADVLSHASTDTTRRYLRGGRLGEWLTGV
jgi:integrase